MLGLRGKNIAGAIGLGGGTLPRRQVSVEKYKPESGESRYRALKLILVIIDYDFFLCRETLFFGHFLFIPAREGRNDISLKSKSQRIVLKCVIFVPAAAAAGFLKDFSDSHIYT